MPQISEKHGHCPRSGRTHTYLCWQNMIARCTNKNATYYKNHGGRGITFHAPFADFNAFLSYMGECPPGYTLEREDNNGNYEPGNIKWATWHEQSRNKRSNRILTHNGETRVLTDWAEILGVKSHTILGRLDRGWSVEEALSTQKMRAHRRVLTVAQVAEITTTNESGVSIAKRLGVSLDTIYRIRRGESYKDVTSGRCIPSNATS